MASILLFITTEASPETINELLMETSREQDSGNCFSLVRSKDQTFYDESTPPTVKTSPTDFINTPFDVLASFARDLPSHLQPINYRTSTFAILDARGVAEKNVDIWHWTWKRPDDVPENVDDWWEVADEIWYWVKFRTPWKWSEGVIAVLSVSHLYTHELDDDNDVAYFDEKGVFQMKHERMKTQEVWEKELMDWYVKDGFRLPGSGGGGGIEMSQIRKL